MNQLTFFGGVDRFEKHQINDNIKVNYCNDNNIKTYNNFI